MAKAEDLTGRRYGRLIVSSRAENRNGKPAWNCTCDCGNSTIVSSANLKRLNGTKLCGCLKGSEPVDITGLKFGKLTVQGRAENIGNCVAWHCICDCGITKIVRGNQLGRGSTRSCGCLMGRKSYNLVGKVFGKISVLNYFGKDERGALWNCLCECGNTKVYPSRSLLGGNTNSCGCLVGKKAYDLIGRTFGKLIVVSRASNIKTPHGTKARWNCVCECGNKTIVRARDLLKENNKRSCGCIAKRKCGCITGRKAEDLAGRVFGRLSVIEKVNAPNKK